MTPWYWSQLSLVLLVAVLLAAAMTRLLTSSRWVPLLALAGAALLSMAPLGERDAASYLLAYSGELSFATVFYLVARLFSPRSETKRWIETRHWNGLQWAWVASGLALYVSALGGRGPDIYALGFGPALAWVALALSALLAWSGRWLGAVLLLGIIWAWQLRLSGGVNFWDYAIDPFLFAGSVVGILLRYVRQHAVSRRDKSH